MEQKIILWKNIDDKRIYEQAGIDALGRVYLFGDNKRPFVLSGYRYQVVEDVDKELLRQRADELEYQITELDAKALKVIPEDAPMSEKQRIFRDNIEKLERAKKQQKSMKIAAEACAKCEAPVVAFQCTDCSKQFCSKKCASQCV